MHEESCSGPLTTVTNDTILTSLSNAKPPTCTFRELNDVTVTHLQQALVAAFVLPVVALILFGNALTLISFITYRRLRRRKYIPVASLAVADMLVGLSAILFLFYRSVVERLHGDKQAVQLIFMIVIYFSTNTSAFHLVVMAIDRFVAARFPFQYRWMMTTSRISAMTAACWISSVLTTAPYLVWFWPELRRNRLDTCYQFDAFSGPVPMNFDATIQLGVIIGVSTLVTVLTLIVCGVLGRNGQFGDGNDPATPRRSLSLTEGSRQSRGYRMVSAIIVAFIICWLPYTSLLLANLSSLEFCRSHISSVLHLIAGEIGVINSGINVVIYAWINADFRHAYGTDSYELFSISNSYISPAGNALC